MSSNNERRAGESDKRIFMRFDKAFPVTIGSEIYGDSQGVARNISAGGRSGCGRRRGGLLKRRPNESSARRPMRQACARQFSC